MAAHRYWRLLCRLNAGDASFTGLTEVQMRTVSGGANVVSGGTPISTGTIQAGSAAQCFDGNTTTTLIQWNGTGAGSGFSVGYDFGVGVTKDIVELVVWPDKDAAARAFGEFDVQFSDDNSTWTTYWSCTATGWVVGTSKTFTQPTAAAHRYWRIRSDAQMSGSAGSVFGLYEIEMKTAVNGTDQCTGGTASARTTFGGWPASQAFDDILTSPGYSSNNGTDDCEWVMYDFGGSNDKDIVEVTMFPRDDDSWQQQPQKGWIESSPDGVSFLSRWTFTDVIAGIGYKTRLIKPSALSPPGGGLHRIWGIRATAIQNGADDLGLAEMELHSSIGGADICNGGGAGSDRPWSANAQAANNPAKAFDNDTSTEFNTRANPAIIAYDFGEGSEKPVPAQISIRARVAGATNNYGCSPTAFDLVYSDDGQNFTTQESFTSPATWTSSAVRLFTVTSAPANGRRRELINC